MNNAITIIPNKDKIDAAYLAWTAIQESSYMIAGHCLRLGKYFKELRDKKLYKYIFGQDDSTWTEFLATPEIRFERSSVYNFIGLYELWVLKLGYLEQELTNIGYKRLMLVTPITRKNPDEAQDWLSMADTLSQSDLINTVREAEGKPPMVPKKVEDSPPNTFDYDTFVKEHPCILHPARSSERAHFPRTKKVGGKFYIPMCHECHMEQHSIGVVSWFDTYRIAFGLYLDELMEVFDGRL